MSSASPNKRRRHSSPTEDADGGHHESSDDSAHKMDIDEEKASPVDNNSLSEVEIKRLLESKQKELAYWGDQVYKGQKIEAHLERKRAEMIARRKKTQRELANVRQDLDASRAHAPIEGAMEIEDATQLYGSLKKNIESFVSQLVQSLQIPNELNLSSAELKAFATYLQANLTYKEPPQFIEAISSFRFMSVHIILGILIRHLLYFMLHRDVFHPFILGRPENTSDTLFELYEQIQAQEPPDRCARWRALAYTHVVGPRSSHFWTDHAKRFRSDVMTILKGLDGAGRVSSDYLDSWIEGSTAIFRDASEVQDRVQTMCLEAEYVILMPKYSQSFQAGWMKNVNGRGKETQRVYIGASCAFVAFKGMKETSGDKIYHPIDIIPATVITDDWVPRQSED